MVTLPVPSVTAVMVTRPFSVTAAVATVPSAVTARVLSSERVSTSDGHAAADLNDRRIGVKSLGGQGQGLVRFGY